MDKSYIFTVGITAETEEHALHILHQGDKEPSGWTGWEGTQLDAVYQDGECIWEVK